LMERAVAAGIFRAILTMSSGDQGANFEVVMQNERERDGASEMRKSCINNCRNCGGIFCSSFSPIDEPAKTETD
jgi:hypothetical protein